MLKITASFVLGLLLLVMHGLGDFTAHANRQGKEGPLMTEKKGLVGELSNASTLRIVGIGGRKMVAGNDDLASSTGANSGTGNNKASKNNFHEGPRIKMNQKGDIKTTKASANKIGPLRSEPRKHYPQVVDEESRRLLEAERKIVNLMRKDYHGSSGKDMGRRKPPINNNEPHH